MSSSSKFWSSIEDLDPQKKLLLGASGVILLLLLCSSMTSTSSLKQQTETSSASQTSVARKKKIKESKKSNRGAAVANPQSPSPSKSDAPTKSKKKKKRTKNKPSLKSASSLTKASQPSVEESDDSDDDFEEEARRLIELQSNPIKPKKTKPKQPISKQISTKSNNSAATKTTTQTATNAAAPASTAPPTIVMDIGTDPAILIGQAGSIIQTIQSASNAKLDVLKHTPISGQHSVRITAPSHDNVAVAVEMIQSILKEEAIRKANSRTVILSNKEIHGSEGVKAIIGRGGSTIQRIQSQCAGVAIDANIDGGTVKITGPKETVERAVILCKNAVFGEAQDSVELGSRSAVQILFGTDFSTIRTLQDSTGAKLTVDKGTTLLKLSGSAEEVTSAKLAVANLFENISTAHLVVPSSDVGAVYGKAGSTLRKIQSTTGAFVEMENDKLEPVVRCTIMGTASAVEACRSQIQRAMDREIELKPGEVLESLILGGATSAVIGRGGQKVKELEKTFSVTINVASENGACQIAGKPDKVKSAKMAIEKIIDPILKAEEAQKLADRAAENGDDTWGASGGVDVLGDADGW